MNKRKERLLEELKSKEYRDAFVSELIATGIPFQIRALRKQRNWTQKAFSEEVGMVQERISVLEDPNYAKLTLKTLKRLASALDIGLLVKFVPISDLVKWELTLSPDSLKALSYDEDPYFAENTEESETTAYNKHYQPLAGEASNRVVTIQELRDNFSSRQTISAPVTSGVDSVAC